MKPLMRHKLGNLEKIYHQWAKKYLKLFAAICRAGKKGLQTIYDRL
jgi:hypothetical protein